MVRVWQGMHHLFVADVPCFVITLALIYSARSDVGDLGPRPCSGDSVGWAKAMLWCKGLLMVWGMLSKATQLILTRQCGTSLRGSRTGPDGVLVVETVSSVLRSTAGSLRNTTLRTREERTSNWVERTAAEQSEPDPGGPRQASPGRRVGGSE